MAILPNLVELFPEVSRDPYSFSKNSLCRDLGVEVFKGSGLIVVMIANDYRNVLLSPALTAEDAAEERRKNATSTVAPPQVTAVRRSKARCN